MKNKFQSLWQHNNEVGVTSSLAITMTPQYIFSNIKLKTTHTLHTKTMSAPRGKHDMELSISVIGLNYHSAWAF